MTDAKRLRDAAARHDAAAHDPVFPLPIEPVEVAMIEHEFDAFLKSLLEPSIGASVYEVDPSELLDLDAILLQESELIEQLLGNLQLSPEEVGAQIGAEASFLSDLANTPTFSDISRSEDLVRSARGIASEFAREVESVGSLYESLLGPIAPTIGESQPHYHKVDASDEGCVAVIESATVRVRTMTSGLDVGIEPPSSDAARQLSETKALAIYFFLVALILNSMDVADPATASSLDLAVDKLLDLVIALVAISFAGDNHSTEQS